MFIMSHKLLILISKILKKSKTVHRLDNLVERRIKVLWASMHFFWSGICEPSSFMVICGWCNCISTC